MSNPYDGQDPIDIAKRAEQNLNSDANIKGNKAGSSSTTESGVDSKVEADFPGAKVHYGDDVSGKSTLADDQGGSYNPGAGRQEKAADFAGGVGGPEDKRAAKERNHGGDDEVRTNIRGPAGDQVRDYAKNP